MKDQVKTAGRLAVPLLALLALSGCGAQHFAALGLVAATGTLIRPDAYIEGTDMPVAINVTPDSAVCEVTQGGKYIGTVRHGISKIYVAKSKEPILVKCAAIGYEPRTAKVNSSLTFYAAFRCVFHSLCKPARRSGKLNQYPGKVTMVLPTLPLTAEQQMAAAKRRAAAEVKPPEPAGTPSGREAVATSDLPPLPPAVQAAREGGGKKEAMVAQNAAISAPLGTWRTTSDKARAWWGREVRHSIAIPPTTLLALQRTEGEWGLFDYRGKNGTRGRIWVALDDVRLTN